MKLFALNIPFGPLLKIIGTLFVADISDISSYYLKLDCTNDPLTGVLHCDDKIEYTDTTEYIDQETW